MRVQSYYNGALNGYYAYRAFYNIFEYVTENVAVYSNRTVNILLCMQNYW